MLCADTGPRGPRHLHGGGGTQKNLQLGKGTSTCCIVTACCGPKSPTAAKIWCMQVRKQNPCQALPAPPRSSILHAVQVCNEVCTLRVLLQAGKHHFGARHVFLRVDQILEEIHAWHQNGV